MWCFFKLGYTNVHSIRLCCIAQSQLPVLYCGSLHARFPLAREVCLSEALNLLVNAFECLYLLTL